MSSNINLTVLDRGSFSCHVSIAWSTGSSMSGTKATALSKGGSEGFSVPSDAKEVAIVVSVIDALNTDQPEPYVINWNGENSTFQVVGGVDNAQIEPYTN